MRDPGSFRFVALTSSTHSCLLVVQEGSSGSHHHFCLSASREKHEGCGRQTQDLPTSLSFPLYYPESSRMAAASSQDAGKCSFYSGQTCVSLKGRGSITKGRMEAGKQPAVFLFAFWKDRSWKGWRQVWMARDQSHRNHPKAEASGVEEVDRGLGESRRWNGPGRGVQLYSDARLIFCPSHNAVTST